jgi:hypothetical protein
MKKALVAVGIGLSVGYALAMVNWLFARHDYKIDRKRHNMQPAYWCLDCRTMVTKDHDPT